MNCNEFREKVKSGEDFSKELEEHKNNCKDCQNWILKEISSPPEGISKEKWEIALSKFKTNESLEDTEDKTQANNNEEEKQDSQENKDDKSLLDYYLTGLKYGIVLGLSIIVGLAIVQNIDESKELTVSKPSTENASNTADIGSNTPLLPIATDSELIPLPKIQSK